MKKILMGLLAVSAVSFSALPEGVNEIEIGGSSEIKVTGTLVSGVDPVKYVVFVNSTPSLDGAKTTVEFGNFNVGVNATNGELVEGTGFGSTPPTDKLYIKRIKAGIISDLTGQDNFTSKIYSGTRSRFIGVGGAGTSGVVPLGLAHLFLSPQDYEKLKTATGLQEVGNKYLADSSGNGVKQTVFGYKQIKKGEFEFLNNTVICSTAFNYNYITSDENGVLTKWNQFFAGGVSLSPETKFVITMN